jgi:hypothetical protein
MTIETAPVVKWRVIGWRESKFQACQGAPVRAGATCQKCGQSIMYVVTLKSSAGEVLDVGQDCAVTLEGGPELAEIRRAERAFEHEQWLASDEFRAQCEREAIRKAARDAAAAAAEVEHALTLAGLRAIVASAATSTYEKDYAKVATKSIVDGLPDAGVEAWDDEQRTRLSVAVRKAYLPPSAHLGAPGSKLEVAAVLEALIPVETSFGRSYVQKYRTDTGAALVWFSKGGDATSRDLGVTFRIRGTVKAHDAYNGEAQTKLTRCRVTKVA